jgi:predicted amidophosphoribosyltransferase
MYCLSCGHNLADADAACPACDQPFNRADPRTYAISPPAKGPRWWRITKFVLHTATASAYFAALYLSVVVLSIWFLIEWLRPAQR